MATIPVTEKKRIAVVGAGVGGLGAALALSRSGHDVIVLERDSTPLPERVKDAAAWERKGAPQFHHSHVFLPRCRKILHDRFPDVYRALLEAGAPERPMSSMFGLPEDAPGAEDLMHLPCRRTTYEWVLRQVVEVRTGVTVEGVLVGASRGASQPPVVAGVRLSGGGALLADVVVASTGRRGDVPVWLREVGVAVPEALESTDRVYLSRFYRVRPGHIPPEFGFRTARRAGIGMLGYEADNQTFSVTLVIDSGDNELRRHLLDERRYDATCLLMPELAPLVDPATSEPVTPVHIMGGLVNRLRRFVDDRGRPVVHGFFAVGDAYAVTNPVYGRGCTLALVQAVMLADAIGAHPGDPDAAALVYEAGSAREVVPWYHLSVLMDQLARTADDGSDFAGGGRPVIPGLADPDSLVAFARVFTLLDTADSLYTNPKLMEAFTKAFTTGRARTALPNGPRITRQDVLNVAA